jgi:acetyl esterase/lipase
MTFATMPRFEIRVPLMEHVMPFTKMDLWPSGHPELANPASPFTPTLTHYPAPHGKPAGAVIVAPGGGYHFRAEHEGEPVAHWLNGLGVYAFVVDYRVAPHRHPQPLRDAQRTIRIVRHNATAWNIRPDRIGILGFSAGGHLASSAGTIHDPGDPASDDPIERVSSRPDALILCYPVINFVDCPHTGSRDNLLGEDAAQEQRTALSTDLLVNEMTPPTFLWHTADDDVVSVENSLRFASALGRSGVPFALHVYPRGPHGLGLAPDDPEIATWTHHAAVFLTELGYADAGPEPT